MRPEDFRDMLRTRPFQPIRITVTDGSTYEIRHPEMALVSRSFLEIGWEGTPGSGVADRITSVSLIHVVKVERLHEAPAVA